MAINKASLDSYIALGDAVLDALNGYDVHEDKAGRACARGTLRSRLNSLRTIATALETRDANAKDDQDLKGMASALNWLKTDPYVTRDFAGIEITLASTAFSTEHPTIGIAGDTDFDHAITLLIQGIENVLLA